MNRFSKLPRMICTALIPALLLSGCWQEPVADPEDDGPGISVEETGQTAESPALPEAISLPYYAQETLDPVTCPDGLQQAVAALLYEGLYELDERFSPKEKLCAAAAQDADGLAWTFTLRRGVAFSDGTALTPADVISTLNRARVSDRYSARLAYVQSVSAADGAVRVTLSRPNASLPALLDIPIVKSGTQSDAVPVGTGPYRWAEDETGAHLAANSAWWGGSSQPVERIALVSCSGSDDARYQFTTHAVQLLTADLTGTDPISAAGRFSFDDADTTVLQYLGFNLASPLFSQLPARQAVVCGIDRATIVSAYLSGHAAAAQFPVSPKSARYPAALEQSFSFAALTAAMDAAGLHTGAASHQVRLLVNSENSFKTSIAGYLASVLSSFDLDVQVEALAWPEFQAALSAGSYDLYYGEVRLGADWDLTSLLSTGGALNYGGFTDPATDALLTEYGTSGSVETMEALCARIQEMAPIVPICFKRTSVLTQEGVAEGLTPTAANPFFDLPSLRVHLSGQK